ncbi:hypothetical protein PR048_026089 [Dryococelus australis]|uniref:HTH psq-type domain-containing protein n=1 Tax=Dryococelus australis TaxID=614101 RepID=A0ABQ9GKE9_9NEOP|nr:hypothetical protein PR048_026089 [Dryococelus australis]
MGNKRKTLDLATKYEIIMKIEEGKGSKAEIMWEYGLTLSSLSKEEEEKKKGGGGRDHGCSGEGKSEHETQKVVCEWVAESLQEAEWYHVAQDCGGECGGPVLHSGAVATEVAQEETGLFHNLVPDHTLAVNGDTCKVGKRNKECLTVLLCTNMDCNNKLTKFMVGKSLKYRGFMGNIVPCCYKHNKKAQMTSNLFTKWLNAGTHCRLFPTCQVTAKIDDNPVNPDSLPAEEETVAAELDDNVAASPQHEMSAEP